jgi:hypothetical protein
MKLLLGFNFKNTKGVSFVQALRTCKTYCWDIIYRQIMQKYKAMKQQNTVRNVPDYRVDDWGSIPGRGKGFSSGPYVQTSSEAHPASYPMGTGVPFPGANAAVA